jgi:polyhydroxybutyrate depolymerase
MKKSRGEVSFFAGSRSSKKDARLQRFAAFLREHACRGVEQPSAVVRRTLISATPGLGMRFGTSTPMRLRLLLVSCIVVSAFAACDFRQTQSPSASPDEPAEPAPTPSEDGPTVPNPPHEGPASPNADAATATDAAPDEDVAEGPCNLPSYTGYAGLKSFEFAGTTRTYELYIGGNYDGHTRFPLTFVFHGDAMTGGQIRSWVSLEDEAGGNGIFVYPNGAYGTWDTSTPYGINPAYAFVDAVLEDVKSQLCVDKKRVFAWGISRGGAFVNSLGCYRGNTFRGVISMAGAGPSSQNDADYDETGFFKCPTPPVAALILHGTADQTIDFSAGVDSTNHWKIVNGCADESVGIDPSPCISYQSCQQPVVFCALQGWPHNLWGPSNRATWQFIESLK